MQHFELSFQYILNHINQILRQKVTTKISKFVEGRKKVNWRNARAQDSIFTNSNSSCLRACGKKAMRAWVISTNESTISFFYSNSTWEEFLQDFFTKTPPLYIPRHLLHKLHRWYIYLILQYSINFHHKKGVKSYIVRIF